MITLETLRSALLSQDPYEATDRLVREELYAGRKTKEVFDEINSMLHEARRITGLTEDGEEALFGVLDALTGNCHKECQYKDPPNTSLPTEEEIGKLPRWAQAGFAARCVRRVLPLVKKSWPDAPQSYLVELDKSLSVSEDAARTATTKSHVTPVIGDPFAKPEGTVARAISAVSIATSDHLYRNGVVVVSFVNAAIMEAAEAGGVVVVLWIRRDFDHVASLAKWKHWTDDTPVPPEVFGPMWPEGPPQGWPPITNVPQHTGISLEFFARERPTAEMIEDDVVNLFNAINRYHIARGGTPLTYDDLRSLIPSLVPAEA